MRSRALAPATRAADDAQVAENIWVCEDKKVTPWKSDIKAYKKHLRKQMEAGAKRMAAGGGVQ